MHWCHTAFIFIRIFKSPHPGPDPTPSPLTPHPRRPQAVAETPPLGDGTSNFTPRPVSEWAEIGAFQKYKNLEQSIAYSPRDQAPNMPKRKLKPVQA